MPKYKFHAQDGTVYGPFEGPNWIFAEREAIGRWGSGELRQLPDPPRAEPSLRRQSRTVQIRHIDEMTDK